MKPISQCFCKFASAIVLCSLTTGAALAQTPPATSTSQTGDPARWYQEDLTPQARFQTSKKEAEAAYKEATIECKQLELANRSKCMRDARAQMTHDLESAKNKASTTKP